MTPVAASGLSPVRAVLDNGAVVIVQEASTTPAVAINATFLAGSVHEPDHLTGLTYLTGRVIDRGTARRPADVIAEELDERGVSLRITTTRHAISFSCVCLAEDFAETLAIVADVARRPVFPEAELGKRRAETVTALRQDEDNPAVRAVESLSMMLYGENHPYGRPAKGSVASLDRIVRDDLVRFHARHVRPAVLSLVIVGDVPAGAAIEQAALELEDWTGAPAGPVVLPPPGASPARRQRIIVMPGKSQTDIAYGFTTISRWDPRYYAYWMMNNILGQFGLGGRLADNIRERQGMAYYAYSSFDPTMGESPLVVRAGVDPRNVDRALAAIDTEVQTLGLDGPTAAEFEQTREFLVGSIPRMLETNYTIASFLQTCELFGLGLDYDQRLPALINSVTIDEIGSAAAEVLHVERAAIAIAGPEPLPSQAQA
ncbi:MAG: pitrilysin family protein [Acidobacteriota bacterium]